jgi:hypothetical protein
MPLVKMLEPIHKVEIATYCEVLLCVFELLVERDLGSENFGDVGSGVFEVQLFVAGECGLVLLACGGFEVFDG